jgi:FixJ family two-component response regulator
VVINQFDKNIRQVSDLKNHIVIVDDDADMNTALKRLLQAAGYQVSSFASAEALIQSEAAKSGNCLILDMHLPGMSGLELSHWLRANELNNPLIFITAYETTDYQKQIAAVGAIACITKPFPGQQLLKAINKAIAG